MRKGLSANKKNSVLVIAGPTASGKSEISIAACRKLNGEIISADSMQVYRHLDIGTAKPKLPQLREIRHHLIDIRDPDEDFNAGDFKRLSEKAIEAILGKGKLPVVIGGTGLYIRALVDGLCDCPHENRELRKKLLGLAKQGDGSAVHEYLRKVDPDSAKKIHPNNTLRIIRALEVYELSGKPISKHHERTKKTGYNFIMFGIKRKRELLYGRIDNRVAEMLKAGLLDEVRGLLDKGYGGQLKPMQSIGYRQAVSYLNGEYDYETMFSLIKRDTRRYAKRQLTWWNKDDRVEWLEVDSGDTPEKIADLIAMKFNKKAEHA